jgi:cytochrome P450 family 142 subfamily A polypeptide 1
VSWADFDLDDRTLSRHEQLDALRWLREHDPVHWDAKHGRWLLTRHAEVRRLAKDDVRFTNGPKGPWHSFETDAGSIENLDGAPHVRARNLVSRGFTPRRVGELERFARRVIDEAIDAVEARGSCDLVADLAVPVPSRVIAEMLGIARDDLDSFSDWCDGITEGIGAPTGSDREQRSMQSAIAMATHLGELIAKRRDVPGPDVLSTLIAAREEGAFGEDARLADEELLQFAMLLVMGGNETTRNAIAGGMLALFDHPDELERLRNDRSLMPTAVDEVLRFTTVVRALRRWVAVDTDFGGQRFEVGQSVVMSFTSANRDEQVFDEPDAFRVDRFPNEHLAFGFGAHYCLGASLARMEISIVLDRLLTRLPRLRLAPDGEIRRGESGLSETLLSVPVEF